MRRVVAAFRRRRSDGWGDRWGSYAWAGRQASLATSISPSAERHLRRVYFTTAATAAVHQRAGCQATTILTNRSQSRPEFQPSRCGGVSPTRRWYFRQQRRRSRRPRSPTTRRHRTLPGHLAGNRAEVTAALIPVGPMARHRAALHRAACPRAGLAPAGQERRCAPLAEAEARTRTAPEIGQAKRFTPLRREPGRRRGTKRDGRGMCMHLPSLGGAEPWMVDVCFMDAAWAAMCSEVPGFAAHRGYRVPQTPADARRVVGASRSPRPRFLG